MLRQLLTLVSFLASFFVQPGLAGAPSNGVCPGLTSSGQETHHAE